jgi:predicted acetyltransferase
MTIEFGPPRADADLSALGAILGWAFGFDPGEARGWFEQAGLENVRLARRGERVVAGLIEVPMGQFFGGRSVSCLGLAGVGVAPEARGQKVALSLVLETLRGARRRGVLLSALYPATLTLYRAAGYELAGSRYRASALLRDLRTVRGELDVTPLEPSDAGAVEALYRRIASTRPGYLDRGPYVWRRLREPRREARQGFAVRGGGGLEGYAYLSQGGPDVERELIVHDLVCQTSGALQRLTSFFADHRSTIKSLVVRGGAVEPLFFSAPERGFRVEVGESWMLRVLDVAGALEARGYPPFDASVDFELSDRTLPENSGRYRLEVVAGRARVTPGGTGAIALDERALAALYSGYVSPAQLSHIGRLDGEPAALVRLGALLAGPPPAMADFF